jgi:hypothetical protein
VASGWSFGISLRRGEPFCEVSPETKEGNQYIKMEIFLRRFFAFNTKTILVAFTLIALSTAPSHACSDLPNICEQQQQELINQNNELAREQEEYSQWVQEENNGNTEQEVAPPPAADPMQAQLNLALANVLAAGNAVKDKAALMKDPKYKRFAQGSWSYFQDSNSKKPGEFCAAFFTREQGFVMLSGPGSDYAGAMLTFWGLDIPKPKALRKIKVTLKQPPDKPQTVTAFNYFNPAQGMGAIAFAVPTIEAALTNILDKQDFELITEGKRVAKVTWHSGLAMKKKLTACVAKRAAGN